MEKIETNLLDCFILDPKRFGDNRGYFSSITIEELESLGFNKIFQVSNSLSSKGTVRGLHYQLDPYSQAKVVCVKQGSVVDVVVDMRRDSETFGQYTSVLLSNENGKMLFVPRGFAHGFVSLEDNTLFEYYVDNLYMPRFEDGIIYNDPNVNIPWDKIFEDYGIKEPKLSEKDLVRHLLKEDKSYFTKKSKKFLVTGFSGQLGYDVKRVLNERGEHNILAVDKNDMDITDSEKVMNIVLNYKPDVIIHCAAWTAVDKAEENPELCENVNYIGTKNIVDASIRVGAKLIQMSTDYVFDGNLENGKTYSEDDLTNPQNVYGKTKVMSEKEALRNPKSFVIRTSWVFGINGNNFVKTMINLSQNHKSLNVVKDQIGSPTYSYDLAQIIVEMAFSEKYGIYHVNNDGYCSWAEFAQFIMKEIKSNCIINPVTTVEYYKGKDMSKIATRPMNSKLNKTKIEKKFYKLESWQEATRKYIRELKEGK